MNLYSTQYMMDGTGIPPSLGGGLKVRDCRPQDKYTVISQ